MPWSPTMIQQVSNSQFERSTSGISTNPSAFTHSRQSELSSEFSFGAEFFFDSKQLVVFGQTLRSTRSSGLDLSSLESDGEIGDAAGRKTKVSDEDQRIATCAIIVRMPASAIHVQGTVFRNEKKYLISILLPAHSPGARYLLTSRSLHFGEKS